MARIWAFWRRSEQARIIRRHRLHLLRRWALRREGRHDGRLAQPDPLLAERPVTTAGRRILAGKLTEAVQAVYSTCNRRLDEGMRDRYALIADQVRWQQRFDAAVAELAAENLHRPDPTAAPRRRAGESRTSEEIVRARRIREHVARCAMIRHRRDQCEHAAHTVAQRLAALDAEIVETRRQASGAAYGLRATYQRAQAIYDQALLRRHPLAELVRPMLDNTAMELPDWVERFAKPEPAMVT